MDWSYEVIEVNNEYHKVIYNSKLKEIIAIVDNLDKDFVQIIIDKHNESIDVEFEKGIYEGIDIAKTLSNRKGNK